MGRASDHAAYGPMDEILHGPISACIPQNRTISVLHYMSTVASALQTLSRTRFLSAPVMKPTDSGVVQWVALVSYHDLLLFLAGEPDREEAMGVPLEKVVNAGGSPPLQVEERTPVLDVIKFMSSVGRMHRCIVKLDNDPSGYSIVSQSDINRYVVSHLFTAPDLRRFGEVQLGDLGFAAKNPVSIPAQATLADAVQIMAQCHVSCLAIVDKEHGDRLMGNFSPSDLRGFGTELADMFHDNIVDILNRHTSESMNPISVSATETLGVLMARMANNKLHHVWIEDPGGKAEGLITLTDVCNMLIKFNPLPNQ